MLDAPGAGLAAPQIGVGLRVFTLAPLDGEVRPHPVNPDLTLSSDIQEGPKGRPSLPDLSSVAGPVGCGPRLEHVRRTGDHRGLRAPGPGHPARDRPPRRRTLHRPDRTLRPARPRRRSRSASPSGSAWTSRRSSCRRTAPTASADPCDLRRHARRRAALPGRPVASDHDVVAAVTRPRRPGAGRGRRLVASPVARRADELASPCSDRARHRPRLRLGPARPGTVPGGRVCARLPEPVLAYRHSAG